MQEIQKKKFQYAVSKYKNILIYIKGSPDPDAIASSFAIHLLLGKFGIKSVIISEMKLSLTQNEEFVKSLNIPLTIRQPNHVNGNYDAYAVFDSQSAFIDGITGKIPCALHIDHHEIINEDIDIGYKLVDINAGSTSSLVALLIKDLNPDMEDFEKTAISTALFFGIQNDTDKFINASKIDYNALHYLSRYSDNDLVHKISGVHFSKETIKILWSAIENQIIYKDWLVSGLEYIEESNRDSIAVVADYLLKSEGISVAIIFALIDRSDKLFLDASFRTNKKNLNLDSLIKQITSAGGARRFKGAFQINLDYFIHCPDKKMLWDVVKCTTMEIIQKQRDDIYITEFKSFYDKIKHKLSDIFN